MLITAEIFLYVCLISSVVSRADLNIIYCILWHVYTFKMSFSQMFKPKITLKNRVDISAENCNMYGVVVVFTD